MLRSVRLVSIAVVSNLSLNVFGRTSRICYRQDSHGF